MLLVEPAARAKSLTVHLFAASRGVDESRTSGMRHLLEHLCVKGVDGKLDDRLESAGAFLQARTLRDALDIQIDVPPGKLKLAFDALGDVLRASGWSAADIGREAGTIEQEIALEPDDGVLTAAEWAQAYGGNGADPLGDIATIRATTPGQLDAVRRATFASANLLLVIEGPIGLAAATKAGVEFLRRLPASKADLGLTRVAKTGPGRVEVEAYGEARGVPVPGLGDPMCVARLCAALAIASELQDAYVTYTPSALNGMVTVGQVGEVGKLGRFIDGLDNGSADGLLARARYLGSRWAARQVGSPTQSAFTRGLLMSRDPRFEFATVRDEIAHLTVLDFRAAIAAFGSGHAFVSVGLP
ncbi:MAG: insulinase family protein [Fimbriimonadaceae bacterium]